MSTQTFAVGQPTVPATQQVAVQQQPGSLPPATVTGATNAPNVSYSGTNQNSQPTATPAIQQQLHAAPAQTPQITLEGIPTEPIFGKNTTDAKKLEAVAFFTKAMKEAIESALEDHGTTATTAQKDAVKATLSKVNSFASLVQTLTSPELLNIFSSVNKTYGSPVKELASNVVGKAESIMADKDSHDTNPLLVDLSFKLIVDLIGSSNQHLSEVAATALLRATKDSEGRWGGGSIRQSQIRQALAPIATGFFNSLKQSQPATFLRAVLGEPRFSHEKAVDANLKEETTTTALTHPNGTSRLASFDALSETTLSKTPDHYGSAEKAKSIETLTMLAKVLSKMQPAQTISPEQRVAFEADRALRIVNQKLAELQSSNVTAAADPRVAAAINAGVNPLAN